MPSQAFIIRSSSPTSRGDDDYAESSTRGRSGKWGLGQRSQPSTSLSSSSYRGKTRFVRESKASRAWTGDWTREDEVAEKEAEAAPSVEKGLLDDAASTEPAPPAPAPAADDSTTSSGSMASLYAQIAARIAASPSTTPVPPTTAQPQAGPSSSMALPRILTKRKRAPQPQRSDWFIAKASEQLGREAARKEQQQQQQQQSVSSDTASAFNSAAQPPSIAAAAAVSSLHPCPTCSQLLPSPCPAPLLRAHLDSIAHRMAQSTSTFSSTPRPPTTAAATTASAKVPTASLPRSLFLDASNAGYRALQAMGWKEGWGMGEEQWKRLQEEALRDEERRIKEEVEKEEERRRRREEVIVVSDSEDEEEEEGDVLFGPLKGKPPLRRQVEETAPARDASASRSAEDIDDDKKEQSPSVAPTTEQAAEGEAGSTSSLSSQPLLEPIAVQLKRDRLGLGRLRAATGRDYPTLGVNASSSAVAADSSDKKRRREERQAEKKKRRDIVKEHERERREWLELRQSLN